MDGLDSFPKIRRLEEMCTVIHRTITFWGMREKNIGRIERISVKKSRGRGERCCGSEILVKKSCISNKSLDWTLMMKEGNELIAS